MPQGKEMVSREQPFGMHVLPSLYFVPVDWKELHFISVIPHKVLKLCELILQCPELDFPGKNP